ncbi:iron transporter [Streptomyces sp. P38-E01]|uniref:Iron transporter n=1 Tax=Streptomyces tardus TaxID=2780544 RepID=A0A949JK91_9ACTN|nr:iron transporter [Streptomyces tardus]
MPGPRRTEPLTPDTEPCGPYGSSTAAPSGLCEPGEPQRLPEPPRSPAPPRSVEPADPRESADPFAAADAATAENLLRCWVRERALAPAPSQGCPYPDLRVELSASAAELIVPVRHWSATGMHRFGVPRLRPASPAPSATTTADPACADPGARDSASPGHRAAGAAVDAVTLAALLVREAAGPGAAVTEETADLLGRVVDSVRQTARILRHRRAEPAPPAGTSVFLEAEQSLLLGHPFHPAPKSRDHLDERDSRDFAPELRGSFPLHWFAVDRSLLAADSAWTERGRTVSASRLAAVLAGPGVAVPGETVPLPLHPWQARELLRRPQLRQLLDERLLFDLGPAGAHWHPTSSVRTVHQPGTAAMLKLSLGLRITNSRRENLRKELHRGVEIHRLLRTGLANRWRAAFPAGPGFDIVRDPAWLAVDGPDGQPIAGLDTVIRHYPFGPGERPVCLAALTSPRPWPDAPAEQLASPLARTVAALARRTGRPRPAVATEWLLRYLSTVVAPVLWLDAVAGVALEAHQQNTLVLLDPDGWPQGGRYRDNQGYYLRTSHREALEHRLPGVGAASDSYVEDAVTDERFAYYLGVNNILGLIGALGAEQLADEELLLAAARSFLATHADAAGPAGAASPLPVLLLDSPELRCKANLLTRLHGLDELVGPVDTQSVYVTIANPLARRG